MESVPNKHASPTDKQDIRVPPRLRNAPLCELLTWIFAQPEEIQQAISFKIGGMWGHRFDFWAYRFLIPSRIAFYREGSGDKVIDNLLSGLRSPNKPVRTSSFALVTLIDRFLARQLWADCQGSRANEPRFVDLCQAIRQTRWEDIDATDEDRNLLSLMALRAIDSLSEAIAPDERWTLDVYEKYLDEAEYRLGAVNPGWHPGEPLLFWRGLLASRDHHIGCIPWGVGAYGIEIAETICSLHYGSFRLSEPPAIDPQRARSLVNRLAKFQQSAWLTARQIGELVGTNKLGISESLWPQDVRKLAVVEKRALANLAQLESARADEVRGGIYAMLASELKADEVGERIHSNQALELDWIAFKLGLEVGWNPKFRGLGKSPVDLLDRSRIADECVRELLTRPQTIAMDGHRAADFAVSDAARRASLLADDQRMRLFELAVHLGALRSAGQIAVPNVRLEDGKLDRSKILRLPTRLIVLFAERMVTAYQEALPWVSHECYQGLRTTLRRMWKRCPEGLEVNDLALMHDALRGQFHAVADSFYDKRKLAFGAYRSLSDRERAIFRDYFAKKVVRGLTNPHTRGDVPTCIAMIPDDTVYVSLAMREGHEMSVLLATKRTKPRHILLETKEKKVGGGLKDWHELAGALNRTQKIWAVTRQGARLGWVPWPEDFVRLGRLIVENVAVMSPHAARIALATPSILRALPWQHLVSVRLEKHWIECCRAKKAHRGGHLGDGLLVCHAPGLFAFTEPANSQPVYKDGVELEKEDDEPVYDRIRRQVDALDWEALRSRSAVPSAISIFAHGAKDRDATKILFNGKPIDEDRQERLTGYAATLVNVCHGGYLETNILGDMGGLPGYFLSHGSACVVAPVTELSDETALRFVQYCTAWLRDCRATFDAHYLTAVKERRDIAFYSVFGDPRLVDALKDSRKELRGFAPLPRSGQGAIRRRPRNMQLGHRRGKFRR